LRDLLPDFIDIAAEKVGNFLNRFTTMSTMTSLGQRKMFAT